MNDNDKETRDFIDYNPEPILILAHEEFQVAIKHNQIIAALRERIMTVKEIHDLFLEEDDDGKTTHSITQQTVYRYLEELESTGLIVVAGFRKTEGVKASERIYGRVANTFLTLPNSWDDEFDEAELIHFIEHLGRILGIALGLDYNKLDPEKFMIFYRKYIDSRIKSIEVLYEKIKEDPTLKTEFSSLSIEEMNEAMRYLQIFAPFIREPTLLDQFVKLYD